jgi:hypothetical protein
MWDGPCACVSSGWSGATQAARKHTGYRTTTLSKDVRLRQAHSAPEYVEVATRCLRRLSKKGNRLLLAGKHPNKVKVACAREMVGFVWESLRLAAA